MIEGSAPQSSAAATATPQVQASRQACDSWMQMAEAWAGQHHRRQNQQLIEAQTLLLTGGPAAQDCVQACACVFVLSAACMYASQPEPCFTSRYYMGASSVVQVSIRKQGILTPQLASPGPHRGTKAAGMHLCLTWSSMRMPAKPAAVWPLTVRFTLIALP